MPTDVPHDWIDNQEKLDRALAGLSAPATLAVDTEFMRRNTFYPELALLQVGAGEDAFLVDPLAFRPGRSLLDAMENPANICIMHSASEDMEAMAELLPRGPGQLFDTQIAAALAGLGPGLSYQKLVHQLTGDELEKGETRSDWLRRPLTESQRDYAALDVLHLHTLYRQLHARLRKSGQARMAQRGMPTRLPTRRARRHRPAAATQPVRGSRLVSAKTGLAASPAAVART